MIEILELSIRLFVVGILILIVWAIAEGIENIIKKK